MPLPTPTLPADFWTAVKGAIGGYEAHCMKTLTDSKWREPKEEKGLTFSIAEIDGSKFHALKSERIITYPLQSIVAQFCCMTEIGDDAPDRVKKHCLGRHQVFASGEDKAADAAIAAYLDPKTFAGKKEPAYDATGIVQFIITSPAPALVSHREFVTVRQIKEQPKTAGGKRVVSIIHRSIDGALADKYYPAEKKCVRGIILAQMMLFEEVSTTETKATFIAHTDPCGKVPAAIMNSVLKNQGFALNDLQRKLDKALANKDGVEDDE